MYCMLLILYSRGAEVVDISSGSTLQLLIMKKNQGKMCKTQEVARDDIGSMKKDEMCKMFKAREAEIIFLRYLLCVIIGLLFDLVFWALF